jgi:hypothetical protein
MRKIENLISLLPKNLAGIRVPLYEAEFDHSDKAVHKFKYWGDEFIQNVNRLERIFELARQLERKGVKTFEWTASDIDKEKERFISGYHVHVQYLVGTPCLDIAYPPFVTYEWDWNANGHVPVVKEEFLTNDPFGNMLQEISKLKLKIHEYEMFAVKRISELEEL